MKRIVGAVAAAFLTSITLTGTSATGSINLPHIVSENPANFTPNVEDDGVVGHAAIYALEQQGSTIYAGGDIHTVSNAARNSTTTRRNAMAFNATTGDLTSFAPDVNGSVWAIEPRGDSVYIGGYFTAVNGVQRRGIAKVDAATGIVDRNFDANFASGAVQQIRYVNGRLLVGGDFGRRLVALDPATGQDTNYINLPITGTVADNAGSTDVYRFAVNPVGTKLVAVGNFTSVGGLSRTRAFMLNLGTSAATVNPWYYQPLERMCNALRTPAYLRDVDFSANGKYFVMVATGNVPQTADRIGIDVCDAAARFETGITRPSLPTWLNYTGGDTLHSVAVAGSAVYVQGHQRWLDNPYYNQGAGPGSVSREGIGAIDPVTGKALAWNPGKTRAVGGKDLLVTAAGLWVGSDGKFFNGEYRKGIAFCPL